jgi:hypothetical protein
MITREGSGFGYKTSLAAMLWFCNDKQSPCVQCNIRRPSYMEASGAVSSDAHNAPAPERSDG